MGAGFGKRVGGSEKACGQPRLLHCIGSQNPLLYEVNMRRAEAVG